MLVFLFTISSTMANKEKMETNSTQSDQENPLDAEFHKAMKESGKEKNYYKSNPKMRPFAMPEKQNFDSVTGELE